MTRLNKEQELYNKIIEFEGYRKYPEASFVNADNLHQRDLMAALGRAMANGWDVRSVSMIDDETICAFLVKEGATKGG